MKSLFKKQNSIFSEDVKKMLFNQEKVLSTIYENATIGFAICDNTAKLIDMNKALMTMLGISNKELVVGFSLFDDPQNTPEQLDKLKKGEDTNYITNYSLAKLKEYLPISKTNIEKLSVHLSVIKDERGAIQFYIFSVESLTEKENYHIELDKHREENEDLHIKSKSLMRDLPIGVGIFNKDGDRTFINEAWADIFGMGTVEEANKRPTNLFTLPILNQTALDGIKSPNDLATLRLVYDFGQIKKHDTYDTSRGEEKRVLEFRRSNIRDKQGNIKDTIILVNDVTEEDNILRELQERKRQISLTLQTSPIKLWSYDCIKKQYIIYNTDYSPDYILDEKDYLEHLNNEDKLKLQKVFFDIETRKNKTFSISITYRDTNQLIFKTITGTPCSFDSNNEITKYTGLVIDTTESHQLNKELSKIKRDLEIVIKANNLSVYTYNVADRTFNNILSSSITRLFGSFDEIFNKIHPDDKDSCKTIFNKLLNKEINHIDKLFKIKLSTEKTYKYYRGIIEPLFDESGNIVELIGSNKDVTEERTLQLNLEHYKANTTLALSSSDILLWTFDINNNTFYSYGLNVQSDKNDITPDDFLLFVRDDTKKDIEHLIEQMKAHTEGIIYAQYYVNQQGKCRHKVALCTPSQRDDNGNILTYTGLSRDDTESIEMIANLRELKEEAERSNKLKSAFLANMSHEIRTPLNAIVGFSDLLQQTDDKNEQKHYSEIINRNNSLLLKLINDILYLSKIESGIIDFSPEEISMKELFKALQSTILSEQNPNIEFIEDIPKQDHTFYLDKNRVLQIMLNFINNAKKFTNEGFIRYGYCLKNNGIELFCQDSGIGISPKKQSEIFERFHKLDSFSQGNGLGLSICKSIVRTLGGTIGVDSKEGEGSRFWVLIPFSICKEVKYKKEEIIEQENMNTNQVVDLNNKPNILVAEDDESNYMLVKEILKHNYNISRAKDGKEAVEKVKEGSFDACLMDIKMPIMNGIDATKEIRHFNKSLYIIALTAQAYESDKQEALLAGCNEYITKPINKKILFQTLEKIK